VARKAWGYAAERTPSTHPVAGSAAPDAQAALQDFDGISYAKGAATLRQLIAHIGDDAFIAGVGEYLRQHAYGNGTLADFMGFMERASGRSLTEWSRAWLLTAGVDVISVDRAEGAVQRTVPARFPADRPHTMDVAGFAGGVEVFRVPMTLTRDRTVVEALRHVPPADLVVPNAADLTWATVTLDAESVAAVPTALAAVPDVQARAVVWIALVDGVCLGTVDPRVLVRTFGEAWPVEDNDSVLNRTSMALLGRIIPTFLPPAEHEWAQQVVATAAELVLATASPRSTRALVAARTVARSTADESLLRAWAAAKDRPAGLEDDSDFGWIAVRNLAARGLVDQDFVEGRRADDDTLQGRLNALLARAAMPGAEAKAWAWSELTANRTRSNYELNALAQGFWLTDDLAVVRPYAERYFSDVPAMRAWVGEDAIARVASLAYPGRVVEEATVQRSEAALGGGGLSAAVRRSMVDGESELREALRSRAIFG
jgi:aminopeptidase N